jgi:hypothetical protein
MRRRCQRQPSSYIRLPLLQIDFWRTRLSRRLSLIGTSTRDAHFEDCPSVLPVGWVPIGSHNVTPLYTTRIQQFFGDTADEHNLLRAPSDFAVNNIDGAVSVLLGHQIGDRHSAPEGGVEVDTLTRQPSLIAVDAVPSECVDLCKIARCAGLLKFIPYYSQNRSLES